MSWVASHWLLSTFLFFVVVSYAKWKYGPWAKMETRRRRGLILCGVGWYFLPAAALLPTPFADGITFVALALAAGGVIFVVSPWPARDA